MIVTALRVLQYPVSRLILLGGALFWMMAWSEGRVEALKGHPLAGLGVAILMAFAAIVLYTGWGRLIERRQVTELSLPGAGREWALGGLLGAGLYTACVLLLIWFGMYQVLGINPVSYLLPAAAMAVRSAVFEELLFRGVLFKSIEDMAGSWIAIIVSSLIFGLIHLINPDATIGGAVYIAIEAGLLLAAAYLVTRRLWMAMGYHMVWNYVQSAVYSGIVSGSVSLPGLFQAKITGPTFYTGGSFGMEQSVFALVLCTITGVILLTIASRRGHLMPAPWRRGYGRDRQLE